MSGYEAQGGRCLDVDECSGSVRLCAKDAACRNVEGSFVCECDAALCLRGAGTACVRDLCCNCDAKAICRGGRCRCKLGFTGDGKTCRRACDGNKCASHARCYPDAASDSGYNCACLPGFLGDGFNCAEQRIRLPITSLRVEQGLSFVALETCIRLAIKCGNASCISGALGTDDYSCICPDGYQFRQGTCLGSTLPLLSLSF